MSSFAEMKEKRKSAIANLVAAAETTSEKKTYGDDRLWKPTVDKAGNGYAVIRFLPAPDGEDLPWVRYWDHGFKGPSGKWYIENSLTSIGQQDPVSEMNTQLWNSGIESDKQVARERKRRLHYVSNILVISDTASPENEGKVFLYKYGKKIFDKIMDVMQPQFEDEQPVNPFDFWAGANFKLKIRQVEGYRNYDKSEFDSSTELFDGDDAKLETVFGSSNSLKEFVDPSTYKTYGELKKKLYDVLGEEEIADTFTQDTVDDLNSSRAPKVNAPAPAENATPISSAPIVADKGATNDDEDTLSYFAKLANE
tara:strand:- start:61 stop:990 length:930 start_codon:yes stop_codon:yes gene_type:complete